MSMDYQRTKTGVPITQSLCSAMGTFVPKRCYPRAYGAKRCADAFAESLLSVRDRPTIQVL